MSTRLKAATAYNLGLHTLLFGASQRERIVAQEHQIAIQNILQIYVQKHITNTDQESHNFF
jgi:hypothetical protein